MIYNKNEAQSQGIPPVQYQRNINDNASSDNSIPQTASFSQGTPAQNTAEGFVLPTAKETMAGRENGANTNATAMDAMTDAEYDAQMDIEEAEASMAGASMLHDDGRQFMIGNEREDVKTTKAEEPAGKDENIKRSVIDNAAISADNVRAPRSIGRKSINKFNAEEIEKTKNFARRYFKELGIKSPFFRAWFGDWRQQQHLETVEVANIPEYTNSNEARKANRGEVSNKDTGWNISISRE